MSRMQMTFGSLEGLVDADNEVRLIDAFTDQLDLKRLGFVVKELKKEGRPAYDSRVFLKLYFYGYLNALRSSRRLESECTRNTELQWLLGGLTPNYHSIADFRKENPKALSNTFKLFVPIGSRIMVRSFWPFANTTLWAQKWRCHFSEWKVPCEK